MSTQDNVQTVKEFFAAAGRADLKGLLAVIAEDIEWIFPGTDWPLAGTWRGHAGVQDLLKAHNEKIELAFTDTREFIAQGDRVLVVGLAQGKMKSTNKPFEDHFIFAMTVRNGKVTDIREYIDTQALAQASDPA
jgi:uncharacterized protein